MRVIWYARSAGRGRRLALNVGVMFLRWLVREAISLGDAVVKGSVSDGEISPPVLVFNRDTPRNPEDIKANFVN